MFPSAKMAVAAAYHSTYDDYHGFLVKQVFRSSFEAAPDANEIISHMNSCSFGSGEQNAITEAKTSDNDSSCAPRSKSQSLEVRSSIPMKKPKTRNPLEQFANHIASEWMKFERFMSQCTGEHVDSNPLKNILDLPSLSIVDLTRCGATRSLSAGEEIPSFIAVMQPVLDGLNTMILELNMKDPSKC